MLETKAILSGLFYAFGVPLTFLGIVENYGTWKADLLFFLSGLLLAVKIVYFALDKYQQYEKRKMDNEEQRYNLDKKKKND